MIPDYLRNTFDSTIESDIIWTHELHLYAEQKITH